MVDEVPDVDEVPIVSVEVPLVPIVSVDIVSVDIMPVPVVSVDIVSVDMAVSVLP